MVPPLTEKAIRKVARRIVEALEQGEYRCCLFGSVACLEWGMAYRVPKDVDVVVFTDDHPEDIKAYLVNTIGPHRCYLKKAKSAKNTYKKLFYKLPWPPHSRCKVDILTAGKNTPLHIPNIPYHIIRYPGNSTLPVMSFFVLLILKVQGWYDNRICKEIHRRKKVPQDRQDIEQLLAMVDDSHRLRKFGWLPKWFINRATCLIEEYIEENPLTADLFRDTSFDCYLIF